MYIYNLIYKSDFIFTHGLLANECKLKKSIVETLVDSYSLIMYMYSHPTRNDIHYSHQTTTDL